MQRMCLLLSSAPAALTLFVCVFVGCGGGGQPGGKVAGTVALLGQPVTSGAVLFYSVETGISTGANLAADGQFQLADALLPGTYRVSVVPPAPPEAGSTEAANPPETVKIPKQFTSEITTPLTATVQPGENHFPLQLN